MRKCVQTFAPVIAAEAGGNVISFAGNVVIKVITIHPQDALMSIPSCMGEHQTVVEPF